MKKLLRKTAQQLLGFERYLFVFAVLGRWRMLLGGYEKEFRFFISLLPSRGVILDIGANIGITTVALAKSRPGASIFAFEPIPVNLRTLERIVGYYRLQHVTVYGTALGNKNGTVDMMMPLQNATRMQGLSHVLEETNKTQQGEVFSVPVKRLDDIADLFSLDHIAAIKLDVENYEYFVLEGGINLLKKHKPVIFCELWGNERKQQCIGLLKSIGYNAKVYERGSLVEYTSQPSLNFFFLPENG